MRAVWPLALSVPTAAMLLFPLGSSGRPNATSTWSGTWDTTFKPMTLTQSGASVEGNYVWDQGHLTGSLNGSKLTGRWDEAPTRTGPNDAGPFEFTLSADGKSFTGRWRHDGDTSWSSSPWDGTCTSGACLTNSAGAAGPVSTPAQRLTVGDLRRNTEYRTFFGLDDERISSGVDWAKLNATRCSDLVDRASGFAGATSKADIPGQTTFGQHSASIAGTSDFHDLLDSSLPAHDLKGNVFVDATKPYEPALRAAIAESEGKLTPADVIYLAMRATHGSYPLAVLTTLNLLKDVTFDGRDAATYASRLVHATPHSDAAIAKERELYDREITTMHTQNAIVGRLVSLRQNPLLAQDKMGPWYHAFTILTVGAIYPVPIPKGEATAFWEHFRKAIGAFGTSEAPFNFEKATLDTCFALATDSAALARLSR